MQRHFLRSIGLLVVLTLVFATGTRCGETHSTIPHDDSIDTQPQTSIESTWDGFRLIIREGTARYEVQEELLGIGFPTDAVGSTKSVTGVIEVGTDGAIVSDGSMIEVDLRTLRSDEERRDEYLQRNTLQTDEYPFATLIPRQILGHTGSLPISGRATFDLIGDLTIRGITQKISWQFVTDVEQDSVSGEARTEFSFGDFSLTRPKVRRVLSVEDRIRLVINFSALLERQ